MSKLENKLVLGDPVGVDGSVIESCDEWFQGVDTLCESELFV